MQESERLQANQAYRSGGFVGGQDMASAVPMEEILAKRAKREAEEARLKVENRFDTTMRALLTYGTTDDVDAASKAVARIAAKAMRRR